MKKKMTFANFFALLGGLALFLYGMQMMSTGLEIAARNRMRAILKRVTANRCVGVLTGAIITAIIQSSSATTVMVVGFVNSGVMTLSQATWIIMGANIGTTITGQLIALDIGAVAPLIAFIGVIITVFCKNDRVKHIGEIVAGLGILFTGMNMMSDAMAPLAYEEGFINIMAKAKNPIPGILTGMVFTAIIQSSSASVGILQVLAGSGVMGLDSAAYILFGQNIGTCITAMLASVGTNRNAKRATIIHVMFNVFGTVIFTMLCLITPLISVIQGFTPESVQSQIANLHTIFNVVTTLILLPVGTWLPKIATRLLGDETTGSVKINENGMCVKYLMDIEHVHTDKMMNPVICIEELRKEILRMLKMAQKNVIESFELFSKWDHRDYSEVERTEDYVDFLNKEISKYITFTVARDTTMEEGQVFNSLFTVTSNIERISDHAMNVAGYSQMMDIKAITVSEQAYSEVDEIKRTCKSAMDILAETDTDIAGWHSKVAQLEQQIDDMTVEYRDNMYKRVKEGNCSYEGNILFSEMLTDFERIGDHALNIADEMLKIAKVYKL